MIKICLLGIITVILGVQFKVIKPEYATLLGLIICLIIALGALEYIKQICDMVYEIEKLLSIDKSYIKLLIKMLGITYITEFTVMICKDSGYSAIGGQIEIAGKLSVIVSSMPVVMSLIKSIDGLLG